MRYLRQLFLIEEEEAGTVLYFLALLLVIGAGMALGRATANALFLKRVGIDYLPILYLAQGGVSFVASLFYAGVADLVAAERFFKAFFAVLATSVLAFWLLISASDDPALFPAYFLFYEVVSEVLLIHSALYLNQNLNTLQAKRLSPVILSGMQFGTILGGLFLASYAQSIGTRNVLLVWLLLVLAALLMVWLWHRYRGSSPYFRAARRSAHRVQHMTTQIQQGFRFARDSELLRLATIAMVFMVITYYIINYSVKRVYTDSYASEDALTAFFGVLTLWTSALALVVQLFITNRLIRRFGVPTVNLFYPLASLGSFVGMIFHLSLPSAVAASVNVESVMPAFHNPVQTIFLNVLPQHIQGRARAMSLAIVLPISLIACGVMLWFLQKMDNPLYFLVPGATAAVLFVYFSVRMNRAYGETLLTHLKEHLFLPREQLATSLRHTGKENLDAITAVVNRGDEMSVSFARILVEAYPEIAAERILPVVERTTARIADQLIKLAATTRDAAVFQFLLKNTGLHDNHFRSTALTILSRTAIEDAAPLVLRALDDPDPRIRATAIRAVLAWPLPEQGVPAVANWLALLNGSANEQLAGLELIPVIRHIPTPETRETVEQACLTSSARIFDTVDTAAKAHILHAYSQWEGAGNDAIRALVDTALVHTDPQIRAGAVNCLRLLPEAQHQDRLESALADGHALVRNAALAQLRKQVPDATEFVLTWMLEENRGSPRAQNTLLSSVIETGLPQGTLESIIRNKIEDARRIHAALATVCCHRHTGNSALELLARVLEERLQQILEIALTAMEPLCPPGVIAVIRGGISTRDKRYVANACEALQSIPNRKLVQPLGQLIQDAFMPGHRAASPAAEKLERVLESLATRPDAWLRECAGAALAASRGTASG